MSSSDDIGCAFAQIFLAFDQSLRVRNGYSAHTQQVQRAELKEQERGKEKEKEKEKRVRGGTRQRLGNVRTGHSLYDGTILDGMADGVHP